MKSTVKKILSALNKLPGRHICEFDLSEEFGDDEILEMDSDGEPRFVTFLVAIRSAKDRARRLQRAVSIRRSPETWIVEVLNPNRKRSRNVARPEDEILYDPVWDGEADDRDHEARIEAAEAYEQQERLEDALGGYIEYSARLKEEQTLVQSQAAVCDSCGKSPATPVVRGFPGKELLEDAARGVVILGGCQVEGGQPKWLCRQCRHLVNVRTWRVGRSNP